MLDVKITNKKLVIDLEGIASYSKDLLVDLFKVLWKRDDVDVTELVDLVGERLLIPLAEPLLTAAIREFLKTLPIDLGPVELQERINQMVRESIPRKIPSDPAIRAPNGAMGAYVLLLSESCHGVTFSVGWQRTSRMWGDFRRAALGDVELFHERWWGLYTDRELLDG